MFLLFNHWNAQLVGLEGDRIFSHTHGCCTHELSEKGLLGSFVGMDATTFGMKLLEGAWAQRESLYLMSSFPFSYFQDPRHQDLGQVRLWISQSWPTSGFCLEDNGEVLLGWPVLMQVLFCVRSGALVHGGFCHLEVLHLLHGESRVGWAASICQSYLVLGCSYGLTS